MRNFHLAGRSTVHSQNAMVGTSHPLAALAAIDVLRSGGTAADAAVAPSLGDAEADQGWLSFRSDRCEVSDRALRRGSNEDQRPRRVDEALEPQSTFVAVVA